MYQQVRNPDGSVSTQVIQRTTDGAFIPDDPRNADWQVYQTWLTAGNTPLSPE